MVIQFIFTIYLYGESLDYPQKRTQPFLVIIIFFSCDNPPYMAKEKLSPHKQYSG